MKFINSFNVAGLGLVAVMDEWTGKQIYERLPFYPEEDSIFGFFSKSEAYRLVDAFRNPYSEGNLLNPPFSPDHCGSTGDCIVYKEAGKIRTLSVSLRDRVRTGECADFSAYGNGNMFVKANSKIECKFTIEVAMSPTHSQTMMNFMRLLNL